MALKAPLPPPTRTTDARDPARDVDGLLAQLRGGDVRARRWAARDLVDHPAAVAALADHLALEDDASVREAVFTTLERQPGHAVAAAMLPLLRSDDAALRNGAIEVLATMPDASGPHVDALLADADPDVRLFAVNLMADLRHARVPQWLEHVLVGEHEPNVVAAAIEVLAEVGSASLLQALATARQRFPADPFIGFAADIAAARTGAA